MGLATFDSLFMHGWLAIHLMLRHFLSHILKVVYYLFFDYVLAGGANGVGI
jgi:hypothetical protein